MTNPSEQEGNVTSERVALSSVERPPFDGSEPCIYCPMEVRSLHASAHNAVGAFDAAVNGSGSWSRAAKKMAELRRVVEDSTRLADAHFADRMHSHGQVN